MDVGVLFSGGKDSTYALYLASKKHKIKCLICLSPQRDDSYMFHHPNVSFVRTQAELMNIPLIFMSSSGEKEEELKDLKAAVDVAKQKYKIQGLVSGAVYSEYQKNRVDEVCAKFGLESIAPLWHMDAGYYLRRLLLSKFKIIITGVAADGFNSNWLGREFDKNMLADLEELNKKNRLNIVGEGGEYESFVLDCPLFAKRIKIIDSSKKLEDENTGTYIIKKIELENK